ncbi:MULTISPECIES: hypothetical protein [Bacillales]|nr:hypothetical protein [Metabacillus sp. B2-18]
MRKSLFVQSKAEDMKQEAIQTLAMLIKKYSIEFKNIQKKDRGV